MDTDVQVAVVHSALYRLPSALVLQVCSQGTVLSDRGGFHLSLFSVKTSLTQHGKVILKVSGEIRPWATRISNDRHPAILMAIAYRDSEENTM